MQKKLQATIGLCAVLITLGTLDAVVLEGFPDSAIGADALGDTPPPVLDLSDAERDKPTPPSGAVRKYEGPEVLAVLISNGLTTAETRERMLVSKVIPEGETLHIYALLRSGDRAGAIAWIESPNVKGYWLILKEALHAAFTPQVADLLDETQRREGRPTRNLLTFFDRGLAPERVVFVRVQERLYEFHIADGHSERIFTVIEALTE